MTGINPQTSKVINSALDGGTLLNPITKADVSTVVKLLTTASPAEAKAIIADMARSGKLATFAQELTDSKWIAGGLNQSEQGALYADMARKLDVGTLSQLYGALVSADKSNADYSAVYGLTDAMSVHTSPNTQLEFIRANAARITAGEVLVTASIGSVTAKYGFDPTAYTTGNLIGKLPPAFVGPAIASLSDAQLAQVVRTGVSEQSNTVTMGMGGGMTSRSWDPSRLTAMLNNAKSINDPVQRTRLAAAATGEFFNMLNAKSNFGMPIIGQAQSVNALRNAIAGVTGRSDLPNEAAKAQATDAELILDITQMSLDIVGIFDQTGVSDAANGVISLGRGDWTGAALSGLALVPVIGALAVAGKLGRWGDTIVRVVNRAATDPAFRAAVEPALRRIQSGLDMAGDQIAKLSDSAKATVATIRAKLDELLGPGARAFSDGVEAAAARLGIPPEKVQELLDIKASGGTLPDPSTYLSTTRIAEHAKAFEDGGSRLTLQSSIDDYGLGQRDGTTFILTRSEADRLLSEAGGDLRKLEASLGLPVGQLDKSTLVRVDFSPEAMKDLNMRMPSGNEAGANSQWLPGGYLPSGANEAVIDGAKASNKDFVIKDIN
jgi:hypothetical protein